MEFTVTPAQVLRAALDEFRDDVKHATTQALTRFEEMTGLTPAGIDIDLQRVEGEAVSIVARVRVRLEE